MNVRIEAKENVLLVSTEGELDHHSAGPVREEIDNAIDTLSIKHIIFDFSHTTFMDSAGIGVIMGRYNKIKEIGGKIAICGCNATVSRLLSMAGLFTITREYDDVTAALKVL